MVFHNAQLPQGGWISESSDGASIFSYPPSQAQVGSFLGQKQRMKPSPCRRTGALSLPRLEHETVISADLVRYHPALLALLARRKPPHEATDATGDGILGRRELETKEF